MLAIVLGLSASFAWGIADFLGGVESRRRAVLVVVLVSQGFGLAAMVAMVAIRAAPFPGAGALWPAALGGLSGLVAILAFYRALAIGTISVVAPILSTSAAVPVVYGFAKGERPAGLQVAGIVVAIVGVALAAREPEHGPAHASSRASILLALVATFALGFFLIGLDASSHADPFWVLATARAASVGTLLVVAVALRTEVELGAGDLGRLAVIGLLDVGANVCFVLATRHGLLSVVVVLASLYPVVTVALAQRRLHERLTRVQTVGVTLALGGAALLSVA